MPARPARSHATNKPDARLGTSIATWGNALGFAMRSHGLDADNVFKDHGLRPRTDAGTRDRYPVAGMQHVWKYASAHIPEDQLTLDVLKHLGVMSFHNLGPLLLCSSSWQETLEACVQFRNIISDNFSASIEVDNNRVIFKTEDQRAVKSSICSEVLFAYIVRTMSAVGGDVPRNMAIHLQRKNNRDMSRLSNELRCDVHYDASFTGLSIDLADWSQPIQQVDSSLRNQQRDLLNAYVVETLPQAGLAHRIRRLFSNDPDAVLWSLDETARRLAMSARTVQRQLQAEGHTFQSLLDDIRHDKAVALLADGRYGLLDVADALGYEDQSSFSRAFRKWSGQTPSQYKAR